MKEKINKIILTTLIILGFSLLCGKNVYAYSPESIGANFDGTYLSIDCDQIFWNTTGNTYFIYFATTTDMSYIGSQFIPTGAWMSGGGSSWTSQTCEQVYPTGILSDNTQTRMAGQPAGTYYWNIFSKSSTETWDLALMYYVRFVWNGTTITDYESNPNETEFVYIDPAYGETVATSTTNTIYADIYLTEEDYIADSYIRLKYVRQQTLQSAVANQELLWTTLDLEDTITSGYNVVATTTGSYGDYGVYYITAELRKPSSWWSSALSWFNPFTNRDPDIITSTTTTFTYGQMTTFDTYVASSTASFNDFISSSTTSLAQVKEACNPISGFDLVLCISGLFIPSSGDISNAVSTFKENVSTHFPLGYFSDFVSIISTTTTGSLTILDAEMPSALGVGNPTIKLDLTHKLDSVLNATTSQFSFSSSTGASSTATFFETTNYYWSIFVYIMTLFYILGRLISSSVIPRKI